MPQPHSARRRFWHVDLDWENSGTWPPGLCHVHDYTFDYTIRLMWQLELQ
jgi:hypothetical protein